VAKPFQRFHFALKPAQILPLDVDDLQRDGLSFELIERAEHLAHAALACKALQQKTARYGVPRSFAYQSVLGIPQS
jgi:hypothetical protein